MKMQHADHSGRPIEVDEERAELLKMNGWSEVAPKSDDKK